MLGSKVSNLLLAEKNLVDFVDKNLGQERERLKQNELELDKVCENIIGGSLDYPKMISHDICDIISAYDVYVEAFTKITLSKIPKEFGYGMFEKNTERNKRLAKMPFRGDELSQKQFINAIITAGLKIRNHIIDCTEESTQSGRLENIYVIISNIVMVRNYVWVFLRTLDVEPSSKLKEEYKDLCDLVEVISEQMLQAQANLLTTYIIHDEASQDWSSFQPYYEGQRGSPTVQMWNYFLKGMQRDMWRIMPPQLSQRVLGIILNDSLGILVARYSRVKPTKKTLPQFVCDIVNILTSVKEFLFYISNNVPNVCGNVESSVSKIAFSIHLKCHCLATILVLVGAPIEILYKAFRRGLSNCSLLKKQMRIDHEEVCLPPWMTVLERIYTLDRSRKLNPSDLSMVFNLKLLSCQPYLNWALVFKVLTMDSCRLATLILQFFPNVLAPATEFLLEGKGFKRCGYASCMSPNCHSLPKSLANHHISSSILFILANTIPREYFVQSFEPILKEIHDWSVLDKARVWTSANRPVWFQSIIDMLLPSLKVVVQDLCVKIINKLKMEADCFSNEDFSTQLVSELLVTLSESLSLIPRGFFLVTEEMDHLIPKEVYPVRNNVGIHFLITALYSLLNLRVEIIASAMNIIDLSLSPNPSEQDSKQKQLAKQDYSEKLLDRLLLSASERLCHLDDSLFDQPIHRLISQMDSMMKQTQTQFAQRKEVPQVPFVITSDLASLKADFLLEDVEGQLALRVAYWFLITHSDVLQDIILKNVNHQEARTSCFGSTKRSRSSSPVNRNTNTSGQQIPSSSGKTATLSHSVTSDPDFSHRSISTSRNSGSNALAISPRIRTYNKLSNVVHEFHFVNKYRTFDEVIWNSDELDWISTVRQTEMGLHKAVILKQLERRTDFHISSAPSIVTFAPVDENPKEAKDNQPSSSKVELPASNKNVIHLTKMIDEIRALLMA